MVLIVVACAVLNLAVWKTLAILIAYGIIEYLDQWRKDKVIDEYFYGWKPCKDEPEAEEKGNQTRIRLTGQNQIAAARVGESLRRL